MTRFTFLFSTAASYFTLRCYPEQCHASVARTYSSPASNTDKRPRWGVHVVSRGGGDDGDERKARFDALLRKAQIDPTADAAEPLKRLMAQEPPADLLSICIFQYMHEFGIDATQKERYLEHKVNFVTEMSEHFENAGIEQVDGEGFLENCIRLLGSDYIHSSMFTLENFRRQVAENPIWKGIAKAALITRLGEECPDFDSIVEDGGQWRDALSGCWE